MRVEYMMNFLKYFPANSVIELHGEELEDIKIMAPYPDNESWQYYKLTHYPLPWLSDVDKAEWMVDYVYLEEKLHKYYNEVKN